MSMGYEDDDERKEKLLWEIKTQQRARGEVSRKHNFDSNRYQMFAHRGKIKL